jgi:hypothetical protein
MVQGKEHPKLFVLGHNVRGHIFMAYCCSVFVPAVADFPVVVRVAAVASVTAVAENLCAVFLHDFLSKKQPSYCFTKTVED